MKAIKRIFLLVCLFFVLLACTHTKSYRDIIEENPVFHLKNYISFNPNEPLIKRIAPAPDFVLSYLKNTDGVDNYKSYTPTEEELLMFAEYLDKLPGLHKIVLNKRLVGIYFIENFQGSGMADFVLDNNENIYCNLFINPGTLKTDMTTWMTFRENTCFSSGDPDLSLVQECGKQYTGLMYILLHEVSHIVDYVCSVTPYIDGAIKEIKHKTNVPTGFTQGVWEKYDTPEKAYDFDKRSEISFYGFKGGPKISKNEAEILYTRCENTPFVSLYGTANWAEDWAESVTWYYFTRVLHQPYEIQIYKGQELIMVFKPMEWEKVKTRIPLIEEILTGEMTNSKQLSISALLCNIQLTIIP